MKLEKEEELEVIAKSWFRKRLDFLPDEWILEHIKTDVEETAGEDFDRNDVWSSCRKVVRIIVRSVDVEEVHEDEAS